MITTIQFIFLFPTVQGPSDMDSENGSPGKKIKLDEGHEENGDDEKVHGDGDDVSDPNDYDTEVPDEAKVDKEDDNVKSIVVSNSYWGNFMTIPRMSNLMYIDFSLREWTETFLFQDPDDYESQAVEPASPVKQEESKTTQPSCPVKKEDSKTTEPSCLVSVKSIN